MSYQQYPGSEQGYGYGVPARPPRGTEDPNDLSLPLYGASFMQASKRFFQSYVKFNGRASRSEYWWAMLMLTVISLIPVALFVVGLVFVISGSVAATSSMQYYGDQPPTGAIAGSAGVGFAIYTIGFILVVVVGLGTLLPGIALAWRRLHDANLAGPFYFLSFIPYAGGIIMIILACLPSKVEGERFDYPAGQVPAGYAPQGYAQPGYQQGQYPQQNPYQQQAQYGQNQYGQQFTQNPYGQNQAAQPQPGQQPQYRPPQNPPAQPNHNGQVFGERQQENTSGYSYGSGQQHSENSENPQDDQRN